ncbi:MAG: N-carbamoylputrescine amidase [Chloroflexota bacterium]|jgi:predicted amidohydrolase|nr:N-carbamoylputrescine amidase [Chloroflexota bacterium]
MKLAVGQFDVKIGEVDTNLASVARLAGKAADAGADLLVLPELCTAGYAFTDTAEMAPYAEVATATELGRALTGWAELAAKHGMHIVGGYPEAADGAFYNSAALFGPSGLVGNFRKIHLFYNEKDLFQPGDLGFPVFDLPFGRVGLMVCYDIWFPESSRSLVLGGAELICTSGNFVTAFRRRLYDERGFTQADVAAMGIAAQNQVYVALSNRIGEERDLGFTGASMVAGWDGFAVSGPAAGDEEALLVVEIELAEATRKRQRNPRNHVVEDRRPEMYRTEPA